VDLFISTGNSSVDAYSGGAVLLCVEMRGTLDNLVLMYAKRANCDGDVPTHRYTIM